MLKKKENIQNYLSTLNSQNVFLTKSPCEKLTGNSFLEQLFQLYFSQVGPQQKIACQCEVGDKTAVLGGQCGWATPDNQQTKQDTEAEVNYLVRR